MGREASPVTQGNGNRGSPVGTPSDPSDPGAPELGAFPMPAGAGLPPQHSQMQKQTGSLQRLPHLTSFPSNRRQSEDGSRCRLGAKTQERSVQGGRCSDDAGWDSVRPSGVPGALTQDPQILRRSCRDRQKEQDPLQGRTEGGRIPRVRPRLGRLAAGAHGGCDEGGVSVRASAGGAGVPAGVSPIGPWTQLTSGAPCVFA